MDAAQSCSLTASPCSDPSERWSQWYCLLAMLAVIAAIILRLASSGG